MTCGETHVYCTYVNQVLQTDVLYCADGSKVWKNQERLPVADLKTLLSKYIDITTPPTPTLLALMAAHAIDENDQRRLQLLATVITLHSN